jgi:hypothetical protein
MEASFRGVWRPLQAAIKKPFWYAVSVPQGVDPDEYKAHVKCASLNSCQASDPSPCVRSGVVTDHALLQFECSCGGWVKAKVVVALVVHRHFLRCHRSLTVLQHLALSQAVMSPVYDASSHAE